MVERSSLRGFHDQLSVAHEQGRAEVFLLVTTQELLTARSRRPTSRRGEGWERSQQARKVSLGDAQPAMGRVVPGSDGSEEMTLPRSQEGG